MAQYLIQETTLKDIADAIRTKTGTEEDIRVSDMASQIEGLTNGVELPELENPAAAADIRAGCEVIDENGEVVVGTMPKAVITVGEPSIDSDGRITASVAYTEGYIEKAGGTLAMNSTVKTAEPNTYYAGVGDRVIEAGTYLKGDIVIKGVALQEKTVTPGEADIVVTPDTDYTGLSKVIVEAVTSGGGGGNAVFTWGELTGAGGGATISHGLGCVPDIFLISATGTFANTNRGVTTAWGISTALKTKVSLSKLGNALSCVVESSPYHEVVYYSGGIDKTSYMGIYRATDTTVVVGQGIYPLRAGTTYRWLAVGGLT